MTITLFFTVSLRNLSASSLAQEDDAGNGKGLQEDIKEINKLVQQKRIRKKKKNGSGTI